MLLGIREDIDLPLIKGAVEFDCKSVLSLELHAENGLQPSRLEERSLNLELASPIWFGLFSIRFLSPILIELSESLR